MIIINDEVINFVVNFILSFFSFSAFTSIILFFINILCLKKCKLNGKYDIVIESSYNNKTIIDGKIEIKVGLWRAKIILKTQTSVSTSKTIFIDNTDKDNVKIIYTYFNSGNRANGNKLLKHDGTCEITFENGNFLVANYYNNCLDRKTAGTIKLKEPINECNDNAEN